MNGDGEDIVLHVGGLDLPVRLSTPPRARRISLRLDTAQGRVVLVKPHRVSRAAAIAFAMEKADWIASSLAELKPPIPFRDGTPVPVLGEMHCITHVPDARRGVWSEHYQIHVSGAVEHLPRRVHDWYKGEARRVITPLAHALASDLGKTVAKISVRDTRSRWGSCTPDGRLSFSWRLVMAPPHVLRYVVAHEVAHLRELNHSARFWQTVDSLIDARTDATAWLKQDGSALHRYGAEPDD